MLRRLLRCCGIVRARLTRRRDDHAAAWTSGGMRAVKEFTQNDAAELVRRSGTSGRWHDAHSAVVRIRQQPSGATMRGQDGTNRRATDGRRWGWSLDVASSRTRVHRVRGDGCPLLGSSTSRGVQFVRWGVVDQAAGELISITRETRDSVVGTFAHLGRRVPVLIPRVGYQGRFSTRGSPAVTGDSSGALGRLVQSHQG